MTWAYYDAAQSEVKEQFQDLLAKVPEGYRVYPLLFVNGEFKSAGSLEFFVVIQAVREALEAQQALQGPVMG